MQSLMKIHLSDLTQEKIQRTINTMAKSKSPKTIRNVHALLSAVLTEFYPSLVLRTTLPQKQRYQALIPSNEEIKSILKAAKGTENELPILLAVWLGLRESEICGITWDSIEGDYLHIKQVIVVGENGPVVKGTKSYSGDRRLRLPPYIKSLIEAQPHTSEYVVQSSGHAMYTRFSKLCKQEGLPHFRFHDLRHANASVMLALNVPDKYAMERLGHATNNMLKMVYQHTMDEKRNSVADAVDGFFESIISDKPAE